MTRRLAALLLLLGLAAAATAARASVEEFASFDVMSQEQDDENAIDHYLSRAPDAWRDEWDAAPTALRVDQGCMTAAAWYQANEFKARAPMGVRTWLDVQYLEHTDFEQTWRWMQFDFWAATKRRGAFGLRYRPAQNKSQQDFALLWRGGDERSRLRVDAAFTVEDMFNTLWEFRQSQVGDHWEPYRAHPFEPELRVLSRGARHRVEVSGKWLTPSRRQIVDPDPSRAGSVSLWGSHAFALAEVTGGAWTGLARFDALQARSAQRIDAVPGDGRSDRRRWIAEAALRRAIGERWRVEARWLYMRRAQDWRPPIASASFDALDRVGVGEVDWKATPNWHMRMGLLYDRIAIARTGDPPWFTFGSRKESRAFIGLQARAGRVRLQGIEGIELDSEPYPVTFHHDKGFLALQTTF